MSSRMSPPGRPVLSRHQRSTGVQAMKIEPLPQNAGLATLQTVLDRLSPTRGSPQPAGATYARRSPCFAKLWTSRRRPSRWTSPRSGRPRRHRARPGEDFGQALAQLRSDLAAAIDASGLRPMLKTGGIGLDDEWKRLLAHAAPRIARGLSRFARWASLRQVAPQTRRESPSTIAWSTAIAMRRSASRPPAAEGRAVGIY